jgi:hypothetical protein
VAKPKDPRLFLSYFPIGGDTAATMDALFISSGLIALIDGKMIQERGGRRMITERLFRESIRAGWVFTLPAALLLSGLLYWAVSADGLRCAGIQSLLS